MSCFYENYVSLCAKIKKSPSYVAEDIGLSRTSPNGWKKGKQPTDVNLQKIAEYFGVTVEELVSEKEKTVTTESDGLDAASMELVNMILQLNDQEKQMLLAQLKTLVEMRGR